MREKQPTEFNTEELAWGLRYIQSDLAKHSQPELDSLMSEAIFKRRVAIAQAEKSVGRFLERRNLPPEPKKEYLTITIDPKQGIARSALMVDLLVMGFVLGYNHTSNLSQKEKVDPSTVALNLAFNFGLLGFIQDFGHGKTRP